ncbi:MAG: TPM domain-containing protein [Clostridiales bacterium]|nr:TPM domain-containing protein [Clostridiales bacterium]
MKKKILFFLTVFCLASIMTAAQIDRIKAGALKVADGAGLLTQEETDQLVERVESIRARFDFDTLIVTTQNLGAKSVEAFADDAYDNSGYGVGAEKDGILLLIAIENRDWHISTHGAGIRLFSGQTVDSIGAGIRPYLSDGDFNGAFQQYLDDVQSVLAQASDQSNGGMASGAENAPAVPSQNDGSAGANIPWNGTRDKMESFLLVLAGSAAISLIVTLIMKSRMNTARPQRQARRYVREGSFRLTRQSDMFLYSHTARSRKPEPPPPNHGGFPPGSGGSATHVSSGSHTHGGGGGKF